MSSRSASWQLGLSDNPRAVRRGRSRRRHSPRRGSYAQTVLNDVANTIPRHWRRRDWCGSRWRRGAEAGAGGAGFGGFNSGGRRTLIGFFLGLGLRGRRGRTERLGRGRCRSRRACRGCDGPGAQAPGALRERGRARARRHLLLRLCGALHRIDSRGLGSHCSLLGLLRNRCSEFLSPRPAHGISTARRDAARAIRLGGGGRHRVALTDRSRGLRSRTDRVGRSRLRIKNCRVAG